jgi:hypothetical protein
MSINEGMVFTKKENGTPKNGGGEPSEMDG